jgi:rhamnopyranosyl-N-acetylglucosaminyl-diphospho-decaprenol beta-1,3/1,4-galactofuranosyltransferase
MYGANVRPGSCAVADFWSVSVEAPSVRVVAVIITLDRPDAASSCLASLAAGPVKPDHVVVVDNGSREPYHLSADLSPWAEVIRLARNTGPAGGAAAGQTRAVDLGADWVWMVDDDAVAEPQALATLVARAETAGVRTYFRSVCYDKTHPQLPFYNSFTYSRQTGLLRPVPREHYQQEQFPFDACAMAGLFLPSSMLREIGVFDASLFGWYDDTEFTLRATLAGFQGYALPYSRMEHPSANRKTLHVLGRSLAILVDQPLRIYYGTRNCILTQRRLLGWIRFFFLFMPLFAVRRFISIVLLYNNRCAFLHYFVKGVSDGLRGRRGELTPGGGII